MGHSHTLGGDSGRRSELPAVVETLRLPRRTKALTRLLACEDEATLQAAAAALAAFSPCSAPPVTRRYAVNAKHAVTLKEVSFDDAGTGHAPSPRTARARTTHTAAPHTPCARARAGMTKS